MNKFRFTPKILHNISMIERLYGQLESYHLPKELQLNLERNNLIQSSYVSNSIEGNPLSLPEVTNLLLGDRLPVNRDEKEVRNYYDILSSLHSYITDPITIQTVLAIHKKLLDGVEYDISGVFRDRRVVVGRHIVKDGQVQIKVKHEPPYHDKKRIETAVQQLIEWLKTTDALPIIKIGLFHHQYVYIHPFADGNGRTIRLLTALLLLQNSYAINKYFVLDDYYDIDRPAYSDALHSADKGDSTKWLEYFTDGIKYSLQSALAKTKNALTTIPKVSHRPTPREHDVLALFTSPQIELTTSAAAKMLGVSRQQAQLLLSNLVNKGLVKKFGSTKSSYYKINK